jgi:hypothetical protein
MAQDIKDDTLAPTRQTAPNPFAQATEVYMSEGGEDMYTSYASIPVTVTDIPEVTGVNIKFTYNFYVDDERTNDSGDMGTVDISDPSQIAMQQLLSEKLPRYANITVTPTEFVSEDSYLEGFASSFKIADNLQNLNFEKAIASNYFSSLKLEDNQIDRSFYYALQGAQDFFGTSENLNDDEVSILTELGVTGDAAFGPDGQIAREALSNLQGLGVRYASTDVREQVADEALNGVRYINFNMNLNNLVLKNIIMGSGEDKTNIYQDELFSTYTQASDVQDKTIASINPSAIASDEFEPTMGLVDVVSNEETYGSFQSSSIPIGYYIDKYEIVQTGTGSNIDSFVIEKRDPVIIESYGVASFQDTKIKYGAVYVYVVRTVVLTRFECIQRDLTGESEDQVVLAIAPVCSGGMQRRIICTEDIPPNPPQNIKFTWDYDNDCLLILWENAVNPQRDTTRYQIFRRKHIHIPFTIVQELDFDQSTSRVRPVERVTPEKITKTIGPVKYYRDTTFGKDSEYIYTVASQDAHGYTSNYSSQFLVSFDRTRNQVKTTLISRAGAPKPYPNIYLERDLFVDTMRDSGHSRLRIFFDPEYSDVVQQQDEADTESVETTSLNLISKNYTMQIINVDDQMSKVINIKVNDLSGPPLEVPINQATLGIGSGLSDLMD